MEADDYMNFNALVSRAVMTGEIRYTLLWITPIAKPQ